MSKPIDDGGQAFPNAALGADGWGFGGMSLRAYFAAKAMQGYVAHPVVIIKDDRDAFGVANSAVVMADALLAALAAEPAPSQKNEDDLLTAAKDAIERVFPDVGYADGSPLHSAWKFLGEQIKAREAKPSPVCLECKKNPVKDATDICDECVPF